MHRKGACRLNRLPPLFRQLAALAISVVLWICAGTIASAQQANKQQGTERAEQLREEALAAMGAGDVDQAFQLARAALRAAPGDPEAVYLMALLLGERNRFPEAIKLLDDLAEQVPSGKLPMLGQTAEWMVKFGQWTEAEQRYRTILEQVPDSTLVHRNLASLFIRQGRRIEAASHLQQMCLLGDIKEAELRPLLMVVHPFAGDAAEKEFDPIGDLGFARNEISQGDWDAARRRLESSASPGTGEIALLGRIYAERADLDALAAWAEKVPETESETNEHADYWFALGSYHASQDDHVAAVKCFCEAVLRDPTDRQAYESMGQSLNKLGATAPAQQAQERAELIAQTLALGAEMAGQKSRDYEKMSTLIDLLNQLQRPLEALAWRGMRLAYQKANSSVSAAQAEQIFADLVRDRKEQLKTSENQPTREFILCGVDPDSLEPAP
jgi:tetratricopeptide (TPR) repeat protein